MNKLFIVILAICLVSTHAFVKRDAPKVEDSTKSIQDQIQGLAKEFQDKIAAAFSPDQIKKGFNEIVDSVNKGIEGMKSSEPKQ